METKKQYVSPSTEIILLNLKVPIQQAGIGINGSQEEEEQWGRAGGGFFGEEEEDGMINGGLNMFPEWDDKDKL